MEVMHNQLEDKYSIADIRSDVRLSEIFLKTCIIIYTTSSAKCDLLGWLSFKALQQHSASDQSIKAMEASG